MKIKDLIKELQELSEEEKEKEVYSINYSDMPSDDFVRSITVSYNPYVTIIVKGC